VEQLDVSTVSAETWRIRGRKLMSQHHDQTFSEWMRQQMVRERDRCFNIASMLEQGVLPNDGPNEDQRT
jgi:hypothetical protein